eukprot:6210683-Pleurochrysis_carterae.AAC.2
MVTACAGHSRMLSVACRHAASASARARADAGTAGDAEAGEELAQAGAGGRVSGGGRCAAALARDADGPDASRCFALRCPNADALRDEAPLHDEHRAIGLVARVHHPPVPACLTCGVQAAPLAEHRSAV